MGSPEMQPKIGDYLRSLRDNDDSVPEKQSWRPKLNRRSSKSSPTKEVQIDITLPQLRLPKLHFHFVTTILCIARDALKRIPRRLAVATVILAVLALIVPIMIHSFAHPTQRSVSYTTAGISLPHGSPTYNTVLPEGKTIEQLGGWSRVSPPSSSPVYAYGDAISGINITVSEQPLPQSLVGGSGQSIEQLAAGFGATRKLVTAKLTVYIGTSTQGVQSLIFSTKGLLILIRGNNVVPDAQWSQYISNLH